MVGASADKPWLTPCLLAGRSHPAFFFASPSWCKCPASGSSSSRARRFGSPNWCSGHSKPLRWWQAGVIKGTPWSACRHRAGSICRRIRYRQCVFLIKRGGSQLSRPSRRFVLVDSAFSSVTRRPSSTRCRPYRSPWFKRFAGRRPCCVAWPVAKCWRQLWNDRETRHRSPSRLGGSRSFPALDIVFCAEGPGSTPRRTSSVRKEFLRESPRNGTR
jgi:hypothetical protein